MGGSLSSHKYKPSKHDKGEDSSSKESVDLNDSRKKKKQRKKKSFAKNEKLKTGDTETSVKKRSSFNKKLNQKPKKRKSKQNGKDQTLSGFNDVESNQITFPKIIITSPSDVEASLDKDSHERRSNHSTDNTPITNTNGQAIDKSHEISLINNNVEFKDSDKTKSSIDSALPSVTNTNVKDANSNGSAHTNGNAESRQPDNCDSVTDLAEEPVEAESSGAEKPKNDDSELTPMNNVTVPSYPANIEAKLDTSVGTTTSLNIDQKNDEDDIKTHNTDVVIDGDDDVVVEKVSNKIVAESADPTVEVHDLNGTSATKQPNTSPPDSVEKDCYDDHLSSTAAISEVPTNSIEESDCLIISKTEHSPSTQQMTLNGCDAPNFDALLPQLTEQETDIHPALSSISSQSITNEEMVSDSNANSINSIIPDSKVSFNEEIEEKDENDEASLMLVASETTAREPGENIQANFPFIDETLSANVVANSSLTTRAESMSSIDRDFSAEEISRQQKEAQMVSEQEAWEKEETLKMEELKKMREMQENENNINEQHNGNLTPKSATYHVDESPLPQMPKSAPPVASKPSYKELSSAPGSYVSKQVTDSPILSSAPQERMSFRDRRKYFEKEIKQQSFEESNTNGSIGRRKKISLVSDQDLRTIKQEEEKKYGTLSRDDIRKSLDIAEEDEDIVEELSDIPADVRPNSTVFIEGKEYKVEKKPQKLSARERLNPHYNNPASASSEEDLIRTLEQDVVRAGNMIDAGNTTEGNGALSERLKVHSPDVRRDPGHDLSPAERRALEAEKRKQWRQARFKSLEADALQAQMMLQQRGRKNDTLPGAT